MTRVSEMRRDAVNRLVARPRGETAASRPPLAAEWVLRLAGAALLGVMAGIHLKLYFMGYREIRWIGPLFMANGVAGSLACLAMLASPRRWLGLVSAGCALLMVGTLGGLVIALTAGLFNFVEKLSAPYVVETIVVESAGFLLLAGLSAWLLGRRLGSRRG